MIEYDLLIIKLRMIMEDNLYCEDNELYIKNKVKYELYELMKAIDKEFINQLEKGLEYNE